ncbi:hypothetical protein WG909_04235 [Peptostreptococcaceae bacterium AGR-M142]
MNFNKKNIALFGIIMLSVILCTVYYIKENKKMKYVNDENSLMPMIALQPSYSPDKIKRAVYEKLNKKLNKNLDKYDLFECMCEKSNKYNKYIVADFDIDRFNELRNKFVKKFRNTDTKVSTQNNSVNEEREELKLLQEQYKKSIVYTCMVDFENNNIVWFSVENRKRLNYKNKEEKEKYEIDIVGRNLVIEELKKVNKKISVDHYIEKIVINEDKMIIEWLNEKGETVYKFQVNKKNNEVEMIFGL